MKYNNDFETKLILKNFNSSELDFLIAICSRLKNKGTDEICFKLDELKKLVNWRNNDNQLFIKTLKETNSKLLSLNFEIRTENRFIQFVLFPTFDVDVKEGILKLEVNKKFAYLLNNITSNFTRYELEDFTSLTSKYSKMIFKFLMKYKDKGICYLTIEDFRKKLDIPEGYRMSEIDKFVLKPIKRELKSIFQEFSFKKIKKGRAVEKLEFRFKVKNKEKKAETIVAEEVADDSSLLRSFFQQTFAGVNYNKKIQAKLEKLLKKEKLSSVKKYLTDTYNAIQEMENISDKSAYFSKLILDEKRITPKTDMKLFNQEEEVDEYEGKTEDDFIQSNLFAMSDSQFDIETYKKYFKYVGETNADAKEFLNLFPVDFETKDITEIDTTARNVYDAFYKDNTESFEEFISQIPTQTEEEKIFTVEDIPEEMLLSKKGKKLCGMALKNRIKKILSEMNGD